MLSTIKTYKSFHGIVSESYQSKDGFDWHISTMKRHNGQISCTATPGTKHSNGSFEYSPLKDKSIVLVREKARATKNKIEEIHKKGLSLFEQSPEIEEKKKDQQPIIGQHILFFGAYMCSSEFIIYKQDDVFSYLIPVEEGEEEKKAETRHIREIKNKFGIGYYSIDTFTTDEELEVFVPERKAKIQKAAKIAEIEAMKQKAEAEEREAQLKSTIPFEVLEGKKYKTTAAKVSALIKAELKAKFPKCKFSVKSDVFSGGSSVDISYKNGPTVDEVEEITRKYQYGHFNGMEDIYESSNRMSFPQAKYVSVHRSFCPDILTSFVILWNDQHEEKLKIAQNSNGTAYIENPPFDFNELLSNTSFYQDKK